MAVLLLITYWISIFISGASASIFGVSMSFYESHSIRWGCSVYPPSRGGSATVGGSVGARWTPLRAARLGALLEVVGGLRRGGWWWGVVGTFSSPRGIRASVGRRHAVGVEGVGWRVVVGGVGGRWWEVAVVVGGGMWVVGDGRWLEV